jgi:acyl phosphate:glycerol-3-phosphate acyltransferase
MLETLALVPWDTAWPYLLITALLSYLLGSIPFGLIFAKLAGAGDIRQIGSGNIGATNVLRTGKKWAAAATLLADAAKGYIAVTLAGEYFGIQLFPVLAGLAAFLGHVYPVWLGFKGGKGVATFIGIAAGLVWPIALLTCASWLVTARAFRFSSLAALVAAAATPVFFWFLGTTLFALLMLILAVLIFITHRANIARLRRGEEPRIGRRGRA